MTAVLVEVGPQFPPNPAIGQLWFDQTAHLLYLLDTDRTWLRLNLPGGGAGTLSPGAVLVTDASGIIVTDPGLTYDNVTDRLSTAGAVQVGAGLTLVSSLGDNGLVTLVNQAGQVITGSGASDVCFRAASGRNLLWSADGGTTLHLKLSSAGLMTLAGNLVPNANGTRDLGSTSLRWSTIYSVNVLNTSLRAAKRDIAPFPPAEALALARATPVYTHRLEGDAPLSDWRRIGLIADDADPLLSPDGTSVSPQVTASLAIAALQGLAERNERLERRVADLEARLAATPALQA